MIKVVTYQSFWPKTFSAEKERLLAKIQPWVESIEHIGSTSVPQLSSKPTIDICISVNSLGIADKHIIQQLISLGYTYHPEYENEIPDRRYLQQVDCFHTVS